MIRVLIERHLVAGMQRELQEAEHQARAGARCRPGYISEETLVDTANPQHNLVISTWRSSADWEDWVTSDARRAVEARIGTMLEMPERITIFEIGH